MKKNSSKMMLCKEIIAENNSTYKAGVEKMMQNI